MKPIVLTIALLFGLLALGGSASAQDVNCADVSAAEAAAILAADPSDPNNLDADSDGIPCESGAGGGGAAAAPAAPTQAPAVTTAPATGIGVTAAGASSLPALLLAVGAMFGGLAVRRARA